MRTASPIACVGPLALLPALLFGCGGKGGGSGDASTDSATDTDSDTDTDADSDTCSSTDSDSTSETDTGSGSDTESDLCAGELVVRVAHDADEDGDGLSWESAFDRLPDGIEAAGALAEECGDCQVWVKQGTYYVYEESVLDTVALREGVAVYGGFTGDETSLDEREPDPTLTVIDGRDGPTPAHRVRHVVTGASDALLDGFTVTGGRALVTSADDPYLEGAGVLVIGAQGMVLGNCVISGNEARDGAGLSVQDSGVGLVCCAFVGNQAEQDAGAVQIDHAEVDIDGCTFAGHAVSGLGGTLGAAESVLSIKRSTVSGSVAQLGGGAHLDNCFVWISSSVFADNSADEGGGFAAEGSYVRISGSTFRGNSGFDASAILAEYSEIAIRSSIFWSNPLSTPGNVVESVYSDVAIDYSVFAGGAAGEGVVNANPLFVDPDAGDYHLQPGSPAIDSADGDALAGLDHDLDPRVDDPDTVDTGIGDPPYGDMGAYEYQP